MAPKTVKTMICFCTIFGSFFLGVFGALRVPLGSIIRRSEAVLGGLGPKKPEKTEGFSRFLRMQVFGSLKLLIGPLGPSRLLWGRFRPQNWSQNGSKSSPKSNEKLVPKMVPTMAPKLLQFGPQNCPKMDPKMVPKWSQTFQGLQDVPKTTQDGPRCLKMAQDSPRRPQDSPKTAPRHPKTAPRRPQDGPRWPQDG